ncbi:MAG TPA: diguanylate cyclase [Acidimicrobiia bacterium]|nr:diguanylate cyclase [Acidimicrobiia bacterium]
MEVGSTGSVQPLTVLLVEDSVTDAEFMEALLRKPDAGNTFGGHPRAPGFEVAVVETLAAALDWLTRRSPDVVVLDLTLPDSEGLATLRSVRHRAPAVPVVVVTGSEETGLGQSAVQQGAQDFLIKGAVTADRLTETIVFAVERHRRAAAHQLRDPLTGLATAALLGERINESLMRAAKEHRYVGVLAIGLGDFGGVDERFGPGAGEELLFAVAGRLCELFLPPTAVARVTGDEFAVVLDNLARPSNAERAGQRVLGVMAPEFKLGPGKLRVETSIGIALGRAPADGPGLLDRARAAMAEQRRLAGQGVRLA